MRCTPRISALVLSVTLALPGPAFALREKATTEKNPQVLAGLEEALHNPAEAVHRLAQLVATPPAPAPVAPIAPAAGPTAGLEEAKTDRDVTLARILERFEALKPLTYTLYAGPGASTPSGNRVAGDIDLRQLLQEDLHRPPFGDPVEGRRFDVTVLDHPDRPDLRIWPSIAWSTIERRHFKIVAHPPASEGQAPRTNPGPPLSSPLTQDRPDGFRARFLMVLERIFSDQESLQDWQAWMVRAGQPPTAILPREHAPSIRYQTWSAEFQRRTGQALPSFEVMQGFIRWLGPETFLNLAGRFRNMGSVLDRIGGLAVENEYDQHAIEEILSSFTSEDLRGLLTLASGNALPAGEPMIRGRLSPRVGDFNLEKLLRFVRISVVGPLVTEYTNQKRDYENMRAQAMRDLPPSPLLPLAGLEERLTEGEVVEVLQALTAALPESRIQAAHRVSNWATALQGHSGPLPNFLTERADPLVQALFDEGSNGSVTALMTLAKYEPFAKVLLPRLPMLIERLAHGEPLAREQARVILNGLVWPQFMAKEPAPWQLRYHSALAAQVPAVVRLLLHRDPNVRYTAAQLLIDWAPLEAFHEALAAQVPTMVTLLADHPREDPSIAREILLKWGRVESLRDALTAQLPVLVLLIMAHDPMISDAATAILHRWAGDEMSFRAALLPHVPTLVFLGELDRAAREHVEEMFSFLAMADTSEYKPIRDALKAFVPGLTLTREWVEPDYARGMSGRQAPGKYQWQIQWGSQPRTRLLKHQPFRAALRAQVATFAALTKHPSSDVRVAAFEVLSELAERGYFHHEMAARGLTPASLGFPGTLDWSSFERGRQALVAARRSSNYSGLSIGSKAFLRWTLYQEAGHATSPEALGAVAKAWVAHLARLEALDRVLELPSAGAELHVRPSTEEEWNSLTRAATLLASGVGPHDLMPAHPETGDQLDLRLLPASPSVFPRLLRDLLETDAVAAASIGAHYTLGVDLQAALVPLALAMFYGDPTYHWVPRPRGPADVGFPGIYTYRGATLDPQTGRLTWGVTQSNLNLRPPRVFETVTLAPGQSVGVPQELFPQDLETLTWLAAAVSQPEFHTFQDAWQQWLEGLDPGTAQLVEQAEQAMTAMRGQGLSDALDVASQALFVSLYRVHPSAVAARTPPEVTEQEQARARPHRRALSALIQETIARIQAARLPNEAVRNAVLTYRQAKTLEELEQAYAVMVQRLVSAVEASRGTSDGTHWQKLLDAVDRDRQRPTPAGLEEGERVPAYQLRDWLVARAQPGDDVVFEAPAHQQFTWNGTDDPGEAKINAWARQVAGEGAEVIVREHRDRFIIRRPAADEAGLEEPMEDPGQTPGDALARLDDLLRGRRQFVSVPLQGFLPDGASATIGPMTPEAIRAAVGSLLERLPKGSRLRWEPSADGTQLTLHLARVPIVRTYPGNRTPWGLKVQFHGAWEWVGDGASLDKALARWFKPGHDTGLWFKQEQHPPIDLSPEQVRELLGVGPAGDLDQLSKELLNVSYWIFTAVIKRVYHEQDVGKDARRDRPEPVRADEILAMLSHRAVGGDHDIEHFEQATTEAVRRAFVQDLLALMGFDQPAPVDAWGPLVLGPAIETLRSGARERIRAQIATADGTMTVLGPSVVRAFERDPRQMEQLVSLAALSQGRLILQGSDLADTVSAVLETPQPQIIRYRGTMPEREGFETALMAAAQGRWFQVVLYRSRFDPDWLFSKIAPDLGIPESQQAALRHDLALLTQA